uniref:HK2 n=1 Tax=Arundo donax TaxID=35708 RepID=A0A0A9DLC6_ARUDO
MNKRIPMEQADQMSSHSSSSHRLFSRSTLRELRY